MPMHMQPIITQSISGQTHVQPTAIQSSLLPVPPHIRDHIIHGEFIEFTSLLPKAMFSGGSEPEAHRSLTVQLASTGNDLSIHPTPGSRKITSFSSWMETWNIYLAICIDYTPTRAAKLIAYQRIITSASIQYPTAAWLSYDVRFCMLAASDPTLYWDARHTDLWLQCMTTTKATQSVHWPCKHCGATNHYPDNCPFRVNPLPAITSGQRATTRGLPNSRSNTEPYSNQSRPITAGTSTATLAAPRLQVRSLL